MAKPELAAFFRDLPLFARLGAERLSALAAATRVDEFAAGEMLNDGKTWLDTIWLPVQGLVRVVDHPVKDEPVTIFVGARGDLVGCFDSRCDRRHELSCVAVVDSLVALLPRQQVLALSKNDPDFSSNLIKMLNDRLWESRELGVGTGIGADQRLARTLLLLAQKLGDELPLTRRMIAELSGMARETAIRALAPFERGGLIRSARGRIQIVSREKLEKLARP